MQLPKDIWDLTALKNINLSSCNLSELHRSFKELKKIETLNLSSNQLGGSLIDLYENFTELRELIIDSNNLEAFPKLSNCRKLVVLSLSNNAIK
jgi:Leucine-rich repeat (LRR) protein